MTNPDLRHITVILDRSGSMITVRDDTEGGLRAFLEAQTEAPGQTTVSLYQFDDQYEAVYERKPLADVPPFKLRPRGATALLDAVGRTITALGEHLADTQEADRPGEVIVVILTDGHENASAEYTKTTVKKLITRQQDEYGWKFVFLGADQDAFAAAGGIGIRAESTLSYSGTRTKASLTNAGHMVARGTASGLYAFSDDERDDSTE
ncbi:VWA domain-containing protein [Streptomyces sp. ActVer]|uniref:vWA domain-containing protein n=1 Tax=Streptomyces sp. ActVer TaxID=3014558 RepID=UPI0022B57BB2|nr:vWA domain-containing protein [Streptomyces sp. ActVer]MCZ4514527.1 VWA domain-containing protein [Streptomyces sp. ActVer]